MKLADQDIIQVHFKDTVSEMESASVSNNEGIIAYFPNEDIANKFATNIVLTIRRLEILLGTIEISECDETSYTELELIYSELKYLKELNKGLKWKSNY